MALVRLESEHQPALPGCIHRLTTAITRPGSISIFQWVVELSPSEEIVSSMARPPGELAPVDQQLRPGADGRQLRLHQRLSGGRSGIFLADRDLARCGKVDR